jgi:hypothetical protein
VALAAAVSSEFMLIVAKLAAAISRYPRKDGARRIGELIGPINSAAVIRAYSATLDTRGEPRSGQSRNSPRNP